MRKIFFIDMDSLFPLLFWGNVITLVFLLIYHNRNKFWEEKRLSKYLILARLCHAFYYFVASGRGLIPDLVSVNLGNTLLFVGFYFEGQAILRVIKENTKFANRLLRGLLIGAVVLFNAVEVAAPVGDTDSIAGCFSHQKFVKYTMQLYRPHVSAFL